MLVQRKVCVPAAECLEMLGNPRVWLHSDPSSKTGRAQPSKNQSALLSIPHNPVLDTSWYVSILGSGACRKWIQHILGLKKRHLWGGVQNEPAAARNME